MATRIRIRHPKGGEAEYPLGLKLGRNPDLCGYIERDPEASGVHCTIEPKAGAWWLKDHSTNGTCVNGHIVLRRETVLRAGDWFSVGASGRHRVLEADADVGKQLTVVKRPVPLIEIEGTTSGPWVSGVSRFTIWVVSAEGSTELTPVYWSGDDGIVGRMYGITLATMLGAPESQRLTDANAIEFRDVDATHGIFQRRRDRANPHPDFDPKRTAAKQGSQLIHADWKALKSAWQALVRRAPEVLALHGRSRDQRRLAGCAETHADRELMNLTWDPTTIGAIQWAPSLGRA